MEYEQGTGRIESLAFKINVNGQAWGFRMPLRWRQAYDVMYRRVKMDERYTKSREDQA